MPSDYKEEDASTEIAEAKPVAPSRTGLSGAGIQRVQWPPSDEALLTEVDAMRQQQEAEARADAAALDEKFGPKPWSSERSHDAEPSADTSETQVVGNPERDAQFWHKQQRHDTCAIAAQRGIIEKHTAQDLGEEALRQEASKNRWYIPGGGTPRPHLGKLLDSHDAPTSPCHSATMDALRNELEQGHDVIAEVDPGLLRQDGYAIDGGHAVWVTGLEINQDGKVTGVFLNDSDDPEIDGGGKVSAGVFEKAWAARKNSMVSTRDSASGRDRAGEVDEV